MTEFAKQVAKQLDRRQRRRKLIYIAIVVAVVALVVMFVTCGKGWGLGGPGKGKGEGPGSVVATSDAAARCSVRVTASGLELDGRASTQDAVLAACRATTGADVVITGDARQGDWDALKQALADAKVPVFVRE